jgi:hypothetical protein
VVNGFANIDQVGNPMSFAQPSFDPACAFREVLEHAPAAESHSLVALVDGSLRFADSPARRPDARADRPDVRTPLDLARPLDRT